jgi:hypothetical protein
MNEPVSVKQLSFLLRNWTARFRDANRLEHQLSLICKSEFTWPQQAIYAALTPHGYFD